MDDDPALEQALRALKAVEHLARESGPVSLDEDYLGLVALVEARPENQPGADKSRVERSLREFRDHYARAERVR